MDNMDYRTRSPTPPMLSRYLEDDSDLYSARINGLPTKVRVDRSRFVRRFLEQFDGVIPKKERLRTTEPRHLLTIKEEDRVPPISGDHSLEPWMFQQKHDSSYCPQSASNRSAIDALERHVEDLTLSDVVPSDEKTPIGSTQPPIVYRAVNGKPISSIDSGIYGISLPLEQQPTGGDDIIYYPSVNTQPSSCDSGLDVSSDPSLEEVHASPVILPSTRLQDNTRPNVGPEGSVSSDASKCLDGSGLSASEATDVELEDEYPNRLLTPARKHMLVELVNRNVRTWFGEAFQAGILEAAAIEAGSANTTESPNTGSASQPQVEAPSNRGSKRKSADDGRGDDCNEDDSDEEEQTKRHKGNSGPRSDAKRDKFACPCYKREPQRYDPGTDCATHVWDIKRLK